jgi:hypothetical protein
MCLPQNSPATQHFWRRANSESNSEKRLFHYKALPCASPRSKQSDQLGPVLALSSSGAANYNWRMTLTQQVQKDLVDAMRNKQELRLSTLRMMKAALKNKEIDKRALLDEKEELQVFSTMIKQRKDSIEQFEKGNRHELAQREADEIVIIEAYMPKALGEEEIAAAVRATIAEMGSPTMKDMGMVMKNAMAKFSGARVDGKVVSEQVKKQLSGT